MSNKNTLPDDDADARKTQLPAATSDARLSTVRNAIANQTLAGLEVDSETVADLKSWARGEMDLETAKEHVLARIARRVRSQGKD